MESVFPLTSAYATGLVISSRLFGSCVDDNFCPTAAAGREAARPGSGDEQ